MDMKLQHPLYLTLQSDHSPCPNRFQSPLYLISLSSVCSPLDLFCDINVSTSNQHLMRSTHWKGSFLSYHRSMIPVTMNKQSLMAPDYFLKRLASNTMFSWSRKGFLIVSSKNIPQWSSSTILSQWRLIATYCKQNKRLGQCTTECPSMVYLFRAKYHLPYCAPCPNSDDASPELTTVRNVESMFGRSLGYLPSAVLEGLSIDGWSRRSKVIFKLS